MLELRVTWIAPEIKTLPTLGWLAELGKIQKIANVKVSTLVGPDIKRDDVALILTIPCDILIWAGHGDPAGLLLPDGTMVRAKWLALQLEQGSRPRSTILAACGSQLRDENLRSMTEAVGRAGLNVIGFPVEAEDAAAAAFTVEFVRALSVGSSIASAFDVAMEEISDTVTAKGVFLMPGIVDNPQNLLSILNGMRDSLNDIQGDIAEVSSLIKGHMDTVDTTKPPSPIDMRGTLGTPGSITRGGVAIRSGSKKSINNLSSLHGHIGVIKGSWIP
jgi:hypothetical protein